MLEVSCQRQGDCYLSLIRSRVKDLIIARQNAKLRTATMAKPAGVDRLRRTTLEPNPSLFTMPFRVDRSRIHINELE